MSDDPLLDHLAAYRWVMPPRYSDPDRPMTKFEDPTRTHCLVPGCRRTRKALIDPELGLQELWICGPHYQLPSKNRRRVYARITRRLKNSIKTGRPIDEVMRCNELRRRIWEVLRRQAVERSLGI